MIRVNDLARELGCKSKQILVILPKLGIDRKVTHSASLSQEEADKVRGRFKSNKTIVVSTPRFEKALAQSIAARFGETI